MEQFRGGLLDAIDFVRKQNEKPVIKCGIFFKLVVSEKEDLIQEEFTHVNISSKSAS